MTGDLLILGPRLVGGSAPVDVGIRDGRIVAVGDSAESMCEGVERVTARGRLLGPAFVEAHLHPDKALLLDRLTTPVSSVQDAIAATAALKREFTREDILNRSERLLREALRMGADVIGGVPYVDPDPLLHVDTVFALGLEFGVPVDFHADFSDEPTVLTTPYIAERTLALGYAGRVVIGHATALGALPPADLAPIADALARAEVSVVTLPYTDQYLGGRGDTHRVRRGLTPVARLRAAGVNVAYASNNVRNAFTPFGNADLLEVGHMLAASAHLAEPSSIADVFSMATINAAHAIGVQDYGLAPGHRADLVLFDAPDPWHALIDQSEKTLVIASGRIVVENQTTTQFVI